MRYMYVCMYVYMYIYKYIYQEIVLGKDLPSHSWSVGKGDAMLHCGCKISVIASTCVSDDA